MIKRLLPFVLLVLLPVARPLPAAEVFDHPVEMDSPPVAVTEVIDGLQSVPVVRAHFTERRFMQSLTRPLTSKGILVFARGEGLYRQVIQPVKQTQFVGPEGMVVERYPDGDVNRMDLSGRSSGRFVGLTFDLFAGRVGDLESSMRFFFRDRGDSWTLGIKPGPEMQQFVKQLTMTGAGRRIDRMTMVHASGDTTVTTFSRITISDTLTKKQKAVFRSLNGE